ncbi:MAG: winged helix-turn-helix domain-containing protein [Desulfobulbaceae bacterium]|nr:winged helix-turn-helix domain-containing protein [Desulfobulbaceae bacterium]
MKTKTKKDSRENTASKQTTFTETGIKVGKALARTSAKAERSTRKVKKMAEELLDSVTGKKAAKAKSTPKPQALTLSPAAGLSVEESLGFLAGDLYQLLKSNGKTTSKKIIGTLKKGGHSEAMIYAAIGWLAREGKITFTPKGDKLVLL